MIRISKYTADQKQEWNNFISSAKNGTFLFYRDYMEYHADRFVDFSLMIYKKEKLVAVMPANVLGDTVYSHQGLTFGGIIHNDTIKASLMLSIFDSLKEILSTYKITTLIYKRIPHIYQDVPMEEDLYALFRHDAQLIKRDISSTIQQDNRIGLNTLRKRMVKKAIKAKLNIEECIDNTSLYPILQSNLREKHDKAPVHTQDELTELKTLFPTNIRYFIVKNEDNLPLAGTVVYESKNVAHLQYICSLEEGRKQGALDYLFHELIYTTYSEKKYFDFGVSTENNGLILNSGLIDQKEMFGGRGVCYDTYKMKIC